MKVQCIKLLDTEGNEALSSPWLKLNSVYQVLSIFIDPHGRRSFNVVTSENSGGRPIFGSYQAECFKIISTVVPTNWTVWIHESSAIGISPKAWQEAGFLDSLLEQEQFAWDIFEQERRLIMSEEP
ncbi:hypothetical protein [Delftia sp. K82]|uniref:hypothetical protein n=1 Tax=Delftia sp. K82 TaxID=1472718 RepID=UPI0011782EBB|nr:hypothetical protein [Delftia sp. K82]